jgi:hypothetical protein
MSHFEAFEQTLRLMRLVSGPVDKKNLYVEYADP